MGLKLTVNGVEVPGDRAERFFAIRIGTGPSNDIVVSENTPGVQEHHCTIVHTGSTYRLEMLPTHLVFVDGERGECGQQLFLHNTSSCTLSIGGAAPSSRLGSKGKGLAPPPQIRLDKVGEKPGLVPARRDQRGPKTNFDLSTFARVSISNLVIAVLAVLTLGAAAWGYTYIQSKQLSDRLDKVATLTDLPPSSAVALKSQAAVFQIGLEKGGSFIPSGTAWAWETPGGERRLVTNIHVVRAINNCSQSASAEAMAKCAGSATGCPAIRYFIGKEEKHVPIGACDETVGGALAADIHADHEQFDRWTRQTGQQTGLPNVYDVALIAWPADMPGWTGEPLKVAEGLGQADTKLKSGQGVAILGYPAEGAITTDVQAATALYRPGWVGRTSNPFGLPADQEDYITIAGPEVLGGESGSPIINGEGKVVAMTFAAFSQAGDGKHGRISYGARMKALSARVLMEQDKFVAADATSGLRASDERLVMWSGGLTAITSDYRSALVGQLQSWKCPAGTRSKDNSQTAVVQANQKTDFRITDSNTVKGWSHSADFELAGSPESSSHIFVMARSADDVPRQVLLSYKIGTYSPEIASSDPTSTLASVSTDVTFSGQQPSRKGSYVVFTPDDVGKNARFELEIHRIDCVPGGQP